MADLRGAREGEVTLASHVWRWSVRPSAESSDPVDFLEWFEFTFQRADDPEQEARNRAGVPRQEWTERTLRSILRSVRERTWRDAQGELWKLSISGWGTPGISTEMGTGSKEEGPELIFQPLAGGQTVERPTGDLRSLTDVSDERLQAVLMSTGDGEGKDGGP